MSRRAKRLTDKELRNIMSYLLKALSGDLAEAVANDCDHYGLNHSQWYADVKTARRLIKEQGL